MWLSLTTNFWNICLQLPGVRAKKCRLMGPVPEALNLSFWVWVPGILSFKKTPTWFFYTEKP